MADGTYICNVCKKEKLSSEFYYRKNGKLNSYKCKECIIKISNKWQREHPEQTIKNKRRNLLKKRYNITIEDYNEMFIKQKGCCGICGIHEIELPDWGKYIKLCIDHDHKTGNVRGLLCNNCNSKLGWHEIMEDAIKNYLNK